nr:RNA-dependent RNA polymerase [Erysiphe necator associated ourmia-like virus 69]
MMVTTKSINEKKPSDPPSPKYNGVLGAYAPQAESPCTVAAVAANGCPPRSEVGATPLASAGGLEEKSGNVRRYTKAERRWRFGTGPHSKTTVPFWVDLEPTKPENRFSILGSKSRKERRTDCCARSGDLRRKVQRIVKLLEVDQSLKAICKPPSGIVCGSLRASVRSMFPPELTLVQELSIKTAAKAEVQPCTFCENLQKKRLDDFRKARSSPVSVEESALDAFTRSFAANVPDGWNTKKVPYVPNGHGAFAARRKEGGNWVEEPFNEDCRLELVYSSGKPRVVTMYSSYNVAVLTPLHHSLYSFLKRRGWLLVGSPTEQRLRQLIEHQQNRSWLSFDYESATDNIKTAYVRRAVDVLISKSVGLSEDEVRCLRVVSNLRLDGESANSGQPMGSPMSFPLLCLINKTVVDLALTDLLERGEIDFKEWSRHRCLINGDDLLTTSTSGGCLVSAIARHGENVGLKVNKEKTLQSQEYGEINSTVFRHCVEQKKTNVASLWMGAGVDDVLGFAYESTSTPRGFRMVVERSVTRLARQKIKTTVLLPWAFRESIVSSSSVKRALNSVPTVELPAPPNLFPVEPKPVGFSITRDEEATALAQRVRQVRERESYKHIPAELKRINVLRKQVKSRVREGKCKPLALLKPAPRPEREDVVLSIFARFWEQKRKEELLAADPPEEVNLPPTDLSRIEFMLDLIRTDKKRLDRPITSGPPPGGCPFSKGNGYVSLSDE